MLHFNIVYFLFFIDIEVVYSSFVYDFFIYLDLILNCVILSIMINFIIIIIYKFFKYHVLFEFN